MPRSLLIVDDDERIRRSLFDALNGPAVSVTTAPSAEAALQVIAEIDPDVALVDVRMPGMDGLELLRLLRDRSPDVAVVVMSAYEDLPTVATAMRDGAVDFLVKPLDLHQVREVVGKIPKKRSGPRLPDEAEDVIASVNHHRGEDSKSAAKPLLSELVNVRADGGGGSSRVARSSR